MLIGVDLTGAAQRSDELSIWSQHPLPAPANQSATLIAGLASLALLACLLASLHTDDRHVKSGHAL